jgi:hypothetical protein
MVDKNVDPIEGDIDEFVEGIGEPYKPLVPICCCCARTPCTRWPTRSKRLSTSRSCTLRATAAAVASAGLDTVGLIGTAFTMEQDFYRDRLISHGLHVLVPDAEDRAEVHRIIYQELCLGVIRDGSRRTYRRVIDQLTGCGAQGIILGCTEIELLISPADSPVPVFPTSRACMSRPPSAPHCERQPFLPRPHNLDAHPHTVFRG